MEQHTMNVTVMISRVRGGFEDIPLPAYASIGAAGMDVRAAIETSMVLEPGERAAVPTGLAIALPPGYECQVRARSGLALRHGVAVVNGPGTIDEDYRGEICVILINHGEERFHIERGDRIAQLVVTRYDRVVWDDVTMLAATERGEGGFGSTGRA